MCIIKLELIPAWHGLLIPLRISWMQAPKKNITSIAFLSLLKMARRVVLQDSGWWRQRLPHHDLWRRFPALMDPRVLSFQDSVMRLHQLGTADLAFVPQLRPGGMPAFVGSPTSLYSNHNTSSYSKNDLH